jgi:hypothetical protein
MLKSSTAASALIAGREPQIANCAGRFRLTSQSIGAHESWVFLRELRTLLARSVVSAWAIVF